MENLKKVKKMEKENYFLIIMIFIQESLKMIVWKEMEYINLVMEIYGKVYLKTI